MLAKQLLSRNKPKDRTEEPNQCERLHDICLHDHTALAQAFAAHTPLHKTSAPQRHGMARGRCLTRLFNWSATMPYIRSHALFEADAMPDTPSASSIRKLNICEHDLNI
jgi:hypothetical protein